ncbi:MAG: hypothetical protein N838_25210 [Thiohalocapsa sp. PB-PSB1]|nr:MAG: hypothetical protein N838_15750 [Thiohalocapsa sp. PB-PSB1]QQO56163.1 MAG: hypothetical protein N838_25210 [Thiohalocapsa sp. PB-PSB1]HCS90867.1 hypothetical protein [Chromatiaceae bacterium]
MHAIGHAALAYRFGAPLWLIALLLLCILAWNRCQAALISELQLVAQHDSPLPQWLATFGQQETPMPSTYANA